MDLMERAKYISRELRHMDRESVRIGFLLAALELTRREASPDAGKDRP